MRDQSYQGGSFIGGLALAIALCLPACVAGEVAEGEEVEEPVAGAVVADVRPKAIDPAGAEERATADVSGVREVQTEDPTAGAPCADPPRITRERRHCRRGHKLTADVLSDPPPVPWKTR